MPDLDLASAPSAEQIRRREFATIRRGYDPDQVRDFLVAVGDSVEHLEEDLRDARNVATTEASRPRVTNAPAPVSPASDPYEALGKRFAGLLGSADKEAQRLVADAKAESTRILTEARAEADRIRVNAQARAEEARDESLALLEKSRVEAERTLTGLSTKREALVDQLQTMRTRLLSAAGDLAVVIEKPEGAAPAPAPKAKPAAPAPPEHEADLSDPRYEDLWVSSEEDPMGVSDLSSLELDFDEERPSKEG